MDREERNGSCGTNFHVGVFVAAGLSPLHSSVGAGAGRRPVNVSLGGGFTAPNSEVRDHLGRRLQLQLRCRRSTVTPVIGIEGLYSFNGLGEKQISIPVSVQRRARPRSDRLLRQHEHAVRNGERRSSRGRKAASGRTAWSGWASTTGRSRSPRPASAGCRATAIRGGTSAIPAAGSSRQHRR